jgi:hypothetical protein
VISNRRQPIATNIPGAFPDARLKRMSTGLRLPNWAESIFAGCVLIAVVPRLITFLGVGFALVGFVASLTLLITFLITPPQAPGWGSMIVVLTLFFGATFHSRHHERISCQDLPGFDTSSALLHRQRYGGTG